MKKKNLTFFVDDSPAMSLEEFSNKLNNLEFEINRFYKGILDIKYACFPRMHIEFHKDYVQFYVLSHKHSVWPQMARIAPDSSSDEVASVLFRLFYRMWKAAPEVLAYVEANFPIPRDFEQIS